MLKENVAEIESAVDFLPRIFCRSFYLALSRTGRPNEERYIQAALKLAERCDLPLVATNDVMFLNAEDFEAHEIRVAIHDGYTLDDPKRPKYYTHSNIFVVKKICVSCLQTFLPLSKIPY